jgi:outer membrane lipoprotein SlyB
VAGGATRLRGIHPLIATAAIAVTAVSAIAAYQFLAPQSAHATAAPDARSAAPQKAASTAGAGGRESPPAAPAATPPACKDCGQVVDIRTTRKEGEGTALGVVAGGVLGGVLGHQVGAGRGKEAMTVVGALGGAFAGNQVEKQVKAQTLYVVDVRMADGSLRTVTESAPPNFSVGSAVRVSGNMLVPQ